MNATHSLYGIPVFYDETCAVPRAVGLWPFYRIVVGPSWLALPEDEKQAVLHHEVGHCHGFHREKRIGIAAIAAIPILVWCPWSVILPVLASIGLWEVAEWMAKRHELEADRFAARLGHGEALARYLDRPEARAGEAVLKALERAAYYPDRTERVERLKEQLCKP